MGTGVDDARRALMHRALRRNPRITPRPPPPGCRPDPGRALAVASAISPGPAPPKPDPTPTPTSRAPPATRCLDPPVQRRCCNVARPSSAPSSARPPSLTHRLSRSPRPPRYGGRRRARASGRARGEGDPARGAPRAGRPRLAGHVRRRARTRARATARSPSSPQLRVGVLVAAQQSDFRCPMQATRLETKARSSATHEALRRPAQRAHGPCRSAAHAAAGSGAVLVPATAGKLERVLAQIDGCGLAGAGTRAPTSDPLQAPGARDPGS